MGLIAQTWSWWWRARNDQDATARSVHIIFIVVLVLLWHAFRPKKRLPPGPPAWPLFGNLLGLAPNLHEHFTQLSRRYGPMIRVRLGSKLAVVVSSPSIAEEILRDQDLVFANRDAPLAAKIISYNGNDVVWGPYGQAWRLLRRVCVRELLNSVSLDMLYEVRRSEVRRLLAGIRAKSGSPVNIGEQVSACALDATTTMLWGGSIVDEEGGGKAAAEIKRLIVELTELLGVPNVSDFFPILAPLDLQGVQRQMRDIHVKFDEIFDSMIKKRLEKREKGNDFLGFLLKTKEEGEEKTPLTTTQIKGILIDLVVAGTDATSNTVEWVMTELLKNPEVMRKVQQEIDEAVGSGRDQHVEELHLTKACISVWSIHHGALASDVSAWYDRSRADWSPFISFCTTNDIEKWPSYWRRKNRSESLRVAKKAKMAVIAQVWSWWWRASNDQDATARSVLTILIVVFVLLWHAFRPKKRLPPGPPAWPLFGNLLGLRPNLHEHFAQLSHRYGPMIRVRLGSKLAMVVSSPSIAEEILKDQDLVFANRDAPLVAKIITYNGNDVAWGPYGPVWRLLRRACVRELLNPVSLDMLYEVRRSEVRRLLARIRAKSGAPVNIGEQVFACALDATTTMLWGGSIVDEEDGGKAAAEIKRLIGKITELMGVPNVSDFFPILAPLDLQRKQRQMRDIHVKFDGIFDSMIKKKLENGDKGNDFLGFLLKMKEEGNEKTPLTTTQIKGTLINLVIGGTDTTSNTVEWAMTELLKNPTVMRRAQQEIEVVVGRDQHVEESHLTKLPYLGAVIKEVLRLHPVLPLLVPHSPSSPCKVAGFDIPVGTSVMFNVWAIHRDPKYWDNPSVFDPERFLRQPDLDFSGRDFRYIPFGSGRRICVGTDIAERMVALILASVIHSFDWHVVEGEKIDIDEKFGIVLQKANPLSAIPSSRSLNPELCI
ncbi:3-9-dihydroxypterocarpan 6A-monooxygenase [Nymphaea thermarum]|nr:3-9-dihydroxypterocarpan 6A-monooxygenase [Nymphaea thermarum]